MNIEKDKLKEKIEYALQKFINEKLDKNMIGKCTKVCIKILNGKVPHARV